MPGEFKGKIVVIWGGSHGIGRVEDIAVLTLFLCLAGATVLIREA